MYRRVFVSSFGALLFAAFGVASAQNAYTARPVDVLAGPNQDYPVVAQLDPGAPLDVHGCLSDWSWCDVSFDDDGRGWVYSDGVSFVYEGERVPLYSYGPSLGLTVITFSLGAYWGDYYRGRPWYSQREEWERRQLPEHRRPPGQPHAGPPPTPHGQPHEGRQPMQHSREPVNTQPEGRGEEHGHGAPPARGGAQQPQRTHAPQSGHPPSSREKSDHGEHGNGHPPQDPH